MFGPLRLCGGHFPLSGRRCEIELEDPLPSGHFKPAAVYLHFPTGRVEPEARRGFRILPSQGLRPDPAAQKVFSVLPVRSALRRVVSLRAFVYLLAPLAGYRNASGGTGLPVQEQGTIVGVSTRRGEWHTRCWKLNEGVQADGTWLGCGRRLRRSILAPAASAIVLVATAFLERVAANNLTNQDRKSIVVLRQRLGDFIHRTLVVTLQPASQGVGEHFFR